MTKFNHIVNQIKKSQEQLIDIVSIIADQTKFPQKVIRKGINEGRLTVNGRIEKSSTIKLHPGALIKFQEQKINVVIPLNGTRFDRFVETTLVTLFNKSELSNLYPDQKILFFGLIIEYFQHFKYNVKELSESKYNDLVLSGLEGHCRNNFSDLKLYKRKELVERLISLKEVSYQNFEKIVTSTTNSLYDKPEKILNEFRHLFKEHSFKLLIKPLLSSDYDLILIIERIIKPYYSILEATSQNERIEKRSATIEVLTNIETSYFKDKTDRISNGFTNLINYFKQQSNLAVGFKDSGRTSISIKPDERTYNFELASIFVYVIIENTGSGLAKKISIQSDNLSSIISNQVLTEILPPGESRKVKFRINNLKNEESVSLKFDVRWENEYKEEFIISVSDFALKRQEQNLPWEELRRTNPYVIKILDDPNKLFGRDQLIDLLKWNTERNAFITSYILYGQKRVGKSSIVRTLSTIYKPNQNVIFVYKTIGDLKDTDANRTFQKIGESLYSIILNEYRNKTKHKLQELTFQKPTFSGSLSPLIELIENLHEINKQLRFIIALDEFDELNKEFFENGEIGKTFALNIGKGLNEKAYIGLILVGSENMISKTSQGMRLNTFETRKVDTFDKETEFNSYCKIITEPSKQCLKFSPEVQDSLYNLTDGNPYFTNILVDKIFKDACDRRISYIDLDYSTGIITKQISLLSTNEFEHFWKDGLSEEAPNYKSVLDRRKRILIAFAETKNQKVNCEWQEVKKKIKFTTPNGIISTDAQIEDSLKEFIQRGIVKELENKLLEVAPKLFEEWLLGPGMYQIISQLDDKDEIIDKVSQEQRLQLSNEELHELSIALDENPNKFTQLLRLYLDQFENNSNKRIIAELLKRFVVITRSDLIEHLKKCRKKIWGGLVDLGVGERDIRTDADIVCFEESYNQNVDLTELIKTTFKFAHNKLVKRPSNLSEINHETNHVIIFEPLIDCPFYYRNEISKLIKKINPVLAKSITIHIVCFVITDEAKVAIEELISSHFYFKYEIHYARITQRTDISPFINVDDTINDPTWKLLTKLESNLDETACLVKIGQIIPFQCIPLLWSGEYENFKPLIYSPTKKDVYEKRSVLSKKLKELKFKSESNRLEFKASMCEPAYNWKKIKELTEELINSTSDKVATERSNEIQKFWSMKLTQTEKEVLRKPIKHSIAKNLAAFANTNGGEIYVGIEDDFTIQGLIYDNEIYRSEEDIKKLFDSIVNDYIGKEFSRLFEVELMNLPNNLSVLKVSVQKNDAQSGIWIKVDKTGSRLRAGNEEFYVRGQQEANQLSTKEYHNWITNFGKSN